MVEASILCEDGIYYARESQILTRYDQESRTWSTVFDAEWGNRIYAVCRNAEGGFAMLVGQFSSAPYVLHGLEFWTLTGDGEILRKVRGDVERQRLGLFRQRGV